MKSSFAAFAFMTVMTFAGVTAANAQQASPATAGNDLKAASFDQYPSFIEIKGATSDTNKAEFDLRCGYSISAGQVTLDPTLNDFSLIDGVSQQYTRFQNIAGKPVVSSPDPAVAGGAQLILEVVESNGTIKAKNCHADASSDSISNCTPVKPLITASQAQAQNDAIVQQCSAFLAKLKVDPNTYDAAKTLAYKQKLDSKLALLEAQ